MHGVVIAGTHSGCGKTTVTLGILAALRRKGLEVQSFKAGPDFIDTGLHRLITGRPSRNLDIWMCGEGEVSRCFHRHAADADVAVVEGVMGMYDGDFSTALLARLLGLPVLLVIDAYGMAESAGAVVRGFVEYNDTPLEWAGVVFNRVASEGHFERLKKSVLDIPVLGYLPRNLDFEIPHRHLGLTVAEESPLAAENIDRLADAVLGHIEVEAMMGKNNHPHPAPPPSKGEEMCRGEAPPRPLRATRRVVPTSDNPPSPGGRGRGGLKLAVAMDKAFCFYYEDNLDALRDAGIGIIPFSPLSDTSLPGDVHGIYIGGGYPELYAAGLSENASLLAALRRWAETGGPLYAECGGLMYLSQGIHDFDGNFFGMAGVFPFETKMRKGRAHLGYREIVLREECILGRKGARLRGHEFHYSELAGSTTAGGIYSVRDRSGRECAGEGYRTGNALASYIHVHFRSNPGIAQGFFNFIKEKSIVWKI